MLVAKHHVTLGGRHYFPGEVIDQKIPADTAEWWLSVGAVENVSPAYGLEPNVFKHHPATPDQEDEQDDSGDQEDEVDDSGDQEDEVDETGDQEDEVDETGEQEDEVDETSEQEDEVDETAEPEEIDVTAGIVRETEAPAEPPAEAPVKEKRKRTPSKNGGKKS